jgi:hypothetical protein
MDPIHPIGPRDRDVEPVQRLLRPSRDGGRRQPGPQDGEAHDGAPENKGQPNAEQPEGPVIDDDNPHIDVRV